MKLRHFVPVLVIACGQPPAEPTATLPPNPPRAPAPPAGKWSYEEGPSHWTGTCASGQHQSPIDLPASGASPSAPAPEPHWSAGPLDIVNDGHSVRLEGTVGTMTFESLTYKLVQFHFHSPSEHTVRGKSYPLEAHFVHKSQEGNLLVVGILFEKNHASVPLAPVWSAIPGATTSAHGVGAPVDFTQLLPKNPRYFTYEGSLTTPPCTEGVRWLVVEPAPADEVSDEQLEILHHAVHGATNRPTQPLHDRQVTELVP